MLVLCKFSSLFMKCKQRNKNSEGHNWAARQKNHPSNLWLDGETVALAGYLDKYRAADE